MRICSPQLGISPNSILGGEVYDREILLGLAQKGVKVDIILPINKKYDLGIKNWDLHFFPLAHFPAFLFNLLLFPFLLQVKSKRNFKVLRIHSPQNMWFSSILFKLFHPEVKLMVNYHQLKESNFSILSNWVNNFWDYIVCDSENVGQQLVKLYSVSDKKITVVHNGVPKFLKPEKKDKSYLKRLDINSGCLVMLFMGVFVDRKNPLFLLKVLRELKKRNKRLMLLYLGSGPLRNNIQDLASSLDVLEQVRFIDPMFGSEKSKILNLADIFVHPSLDEGFALAPLEAMATGKLVIMNNAHSAQEAIDQGVNGYICKANSVKDWADKIEYLDNNKRKIKIMGANSLKKVNESFQWERVVDTHLKLLNKI